MKPKKVFKRVLAEYFRYVLRREIGCGDECCFDFRTMWIYLDNLDKYFDSSEIPRITNRYFTKIDVRMKNDLIKDFPHLKPYFKESIWRMRDHVNSSEESEINFSDSSVASVFLPNSSILDPEPSTSGYRSSGTRSLNNSPSGSRASSPVPVIINNSPIGSRASSPVPVRINKSSFTSRSNSPKRIRIKKFPTKRPLNSSKHRRQYNLRNKTIQYREQPDVEQRQPKQTYRKRLKLYPYLNRLPVNLPHLKPNESTLHLQSLGGVDLDGFNFNLPSPFCKSIRQQFRVLNPVAKRYTTYADDNSDNIPLHMALKY